ncbi:unnamed protein product, partial [Timema podura]|nr:unnamed protein product [Timema podura]
MAQELLKFRQRAEAALHTVTETSIMLYTGDATLAGEWREGRLAYPHPTHNNLHKGDTLRRKGPDPPSHLSSCNLEEEIKNLYKDIESIRNQTNNFAGNNIPKELADLVCFILSLDVIVENFGGDVWISNFTTHCHIFIHADEVHIADSRIRSNFLSVSIAGAASFTVSPSFSFLAVEAEGKSKSEPQDTSNNRMQCIKSVLIDLFTRTIKEAFPDVPDPPVPVVPSQFCDYQCNSALPITQLLKAQGLKLSPRSVGEKIVALFPKTPLVEKLEVAGPGFINISLSKEYIIRILTETLRSGVRPPPLDKRLRVVVDFSSSKYC